MRSLLDAGHPWRVPAISKRHRLYDAQLLDVLDRQAGEIQCIFNSLFTHNRVGRVLSFLDEATTPLEELGIISTLPTRPFLNALPGFAASSVSQFRPHF